MPRVPGSHAYISISLMCAALVTRVTAKRLHLPESRSCVKKLSMIHLMGYPGNYPGKHTPLRGGRSGDAGPPSKVLVIAGGLGVGKTIIVDSIARILAANGVGPLEVSRSAIIKFTVPAIAGHEASCGIHDTVYPIGVSPGHRCGRYWYRRLRLGSAQREFSHSFLQAHGTIYLKDFGEWRYV